MHKLRKKIEKKINALGIECSPQAISALYYASTLSSPENVGCSDSLLLGLLQSGSYTVDALIDSGVDTTHLQEIADNSAGYGIDDEVDPIEMLFASQGIFGEYLANFPTNASYLETSNLLEISVSPESLGGSTAGWFPKELSCSPDPQTSILQEIENQVCYVVDACVDIISKKSFVTLERRNKPLTTKEKNKISEYFSDYLNPTEIKWALYLTDQWLTNKILSLDNSEISLGIIDRLFGDLRLGSSMFLESGGNFSTLSTSLQVAKRYAPERDQPLIGLIERDGRIYVKNYSYRTSARLESDIRSSVLSIGAEVPLPLTTVTVLSEFEELINSQSIREGQIQKFLEAYPEIIESLGYATCKPHVVLQQPGQKDLIPDFILQRPGNNGFDILDLKLPTARVAIANPFLRISHEITKALAQLRAYKNFFNNPSNTSTFYKTYGLDPLTPELIVVIGRSTEVLSFQDRVEISKQAGGLRIISYDELIDYGKSRAIKIPKIG
jgi:hypothetical protein